MLNEKSQATPTNDDAFAIGGATKVDRYKWVKAGDPGEVVWMPPADLHADDAYQRAANQTKVKGIAASFSWPAFGVIIGVRRKDGTVYTVDGWHRVLAARKRADVAKVPVIVFDMDDTTEEARAFLGANTLRKPLTSIEKFKAMVMSGNAAAQMVDDLMTRHGRFPYNGDKPGGIHCVGKLLALAEGEPDRLRTLWPLMMSLSADRSLQEKIVGALMYLERNAIDGSTLTDPLWSKKLLRIGAVEMTIAATRMASAYAGGGDKVWAHGVLRLLNKGQKSRRFTVATITDDADG